MTPQTPSSPLDVLEADELFMLGLRASAANDGAAALSYLKLAVARQPAHAKAHWMLGAEYAALRMPERATEHFARAVALDPAQPVARFQYGLLLLTRGQVEAADEIWRGLDELPATDPLRRFVNGLLLIARDRASEAGPELRAAAADPATEPALRRDIEAVIERIGAAPADERAGAPQKRRVGVAESPTDPDERSVQSHLALSAYAGNESSRH